MYINDNRTDTRRNKRSINCACVCACAHACVLFYTYSRAELCFGHVVEVILNQHAAESNRSNRKAMNRNWSNQKANPALKTKTGNK